MSTLGTGPMMMIGNGKTHMDMGVMSSRITE